VSAPDFRFVKAAFDIGIAFATPDDERLAPLLATWRDDAGAIFDEVLPLGGGRRQHRHHWGASVIKLNAHRDGQAPGTRTGLGPLVLVGPDRAPGRIEDAEGNVVRREAGPTAAVHLGMAVPDPARTLAFLEALGLPVADGAAAVGDGRLLVRGGPDAVTDAALDGTGLRYLTLQVDAVDAAHARALEAGGQEGMAPRTLGDVARISFVREPSGGHWIELSQRRSLVGHLDAGEP
jgi:lactoylglutathione lyase